MYAHTCIRCMRIDADNYKRYAYAYAYLGAVHQRGGERPVTLAEG